MNQENEQPQALQLADALCSMADNGDMGRKPDPKCQKRQAATELRRLHELNAELLAALKLEMNEELRQLRIENKLLREEGRSVDAVDTLTEEGWLWDGDQWQRPPELNQFKPDYNTEAVLVEEMQRMAKRIEDLEALMEHQAARIVDLQTHIENFEGEE